MFGSSIIDIAIGMIFIYLLLSLICSAANELIERYSRKRAKDLENGIKEMLESPNLVKSLYEHPLVYSLFQKPYSPAAKNLPSYIPARNFALALMDLVGNHSAEGATTADSTSPPPADALDKLRAAVGANKTLPDQVRKALLTFVDSNSHPAKVRESIENWFDSAMDRVSGVYKRRTQLILFLLGLFLAILLNANSVTLIRALSSDRALRDSLVAAAPEFAKNNPLPAPSPSPSTSTSPASASSTGTPAPAGASTPADAQSSPATPTPTASPASTPASTPATPAVAGASPSPKACKDDTPQCRIANNLDDIKRLELPIGWSESVRNEFKNDFWHSLLLGLIGWLITALALSLGAPFWFDILNKFMVVRSTVKPKEKSPDEKSKG